MYEELDALIERAITDGRSPLYCAPVAAEAARIAGLTNREPFRVTDARLQALKKRGRIEHQKATLNDKGGWRIKSA